VNDSVADVLSKTACLLMLVMRFKYRGARVAQANTFGSSVWESKATAVDTTIGRLRLRHARV
jgi:hypothetical protein